jgi:hypothetical protein
MRTLVSLSDNSYSRESCSSSLTQFGDGSTGRRTINWPTHNQARENIITVTRQERSPVMFPSRAFVGL